MATIHQEFEVDLPAARVWARLRAFTELDQLAAGFITQCLAEEEGAVRRITFFNGMEARERLVTCDDAARRLVYTVLGGRASHHNASAQVFELDAGRCRFVWITDLLPDALAPAIGQMAQRGAQAMQVTLTRSAG